MQIFSCMNSLLSLECALLDADLAQQVEQLTCNQ